MRRVLRPEAHVCSNLCARRGSGQEVPYSDFMATGKRYANMTYDELFEAITHASRGDWVRDEAQGVSTLRSDVRIQVARVKREESGSSFRVPWTSVHPDPQAWREYYCVRFCGAAIRQFMLVSVDGGRAELPPPAPGTKNIPAEQYALARAVDYTGRLEEYIQRSGLTVQ